MKITASDLVRKNIYSQKEDIKSIFDRLKECSTAEIGITRDTYGEGESRAHGLLGEMARSFGLEVSTDAAANTYMTLPGVDRGAPRVIIGSHLDSVPNGGNFDGAAGVVAGLVCLKALSDAGFRPECDISVMGIRAEESVWFQISYIGSRAALGNLPPNALAAPRIDTGEPLAAHIAASGGDPDALERGVAALKPQEVRAFLELHIEQAPSLVELGKSIGIGIAIPGNFRFPDVRITGVYGHVGTPRRFRRDAVLAATEFAHRLDAIWKRLEEEGTPMAMTLGRFHTNIEAHGLTTVTILRAGQVAANLETSETDKHELARIMIGRDFADPREATSAPGATRLVVRGLCATDRRGLPVLDRLSFELRAGEVLGIAGVDGNGQTELADAIVGLLPLESGTIELDGKDISRTSSRERHREYRMGYVPADRHGQAILLSCSVADNAALREYDSGRFCFGKWRVDRNIAEYTRSIVQRYDVRLSDIDQNISYLSGGNQQKIVVGREIIDGLRVLIVAQPTKGVDIGAIEFIHSELIKLRNSGVAIVYISTELELLLEVADRVCVINRGRLSDAMDRSEATPELIGLLMAGASEAKKVIQ